MSQQTTNDTLLELKDYSITFDTPDGQVKAVSNMNLSIKRGERVAIVGESGSGKSQTFLGIMGLLAKNGKTTGKALLGGKDVLALKPRELDQVRSKDMAMVFQDPMTALNPSLRISRQLTEQLDRTRFYGNKVNISPNKRNAFVLPEHYTEGVKIFTFAAYRNNHSSKA